MTVTELHAFIGRTGTVHISGQSGIAFGVKVVNVKVAYSDICLLCEPLQGTGTKWYRIDSVTLN